MCQTSQGHMRTSSLRFCGFGSPWPQRAHLRALNSNTERLFPPSQDGETAESKRWHPRSARRQGLRAGNVHDADALAVVRVGTVPCDVFHGEVGRVPPPKAREMNLRGELGVICTNIPSLETLSRELFGCLDQTWKVVCFKRNLCIILHGGSTIHIRLGNQTPPPKPGRPSGSFPSPTQELPRPTCICPSTM